MFACLTVDVQPKRKLAAKHKNCKKAKKKKKKVNWLIIYFWNLFKSCFLTTLQILAAIQSRRCLGVVAQIIMLRGLCPLVCAWGEWWGLHGGRRSNRWIQWLLLSAQISLSCTRTPHMHWADTQCSSMSLCFNKSNHEAKFLSAWCDRATETEKRGEKTSVSTTAGSSEMPRG